MTQFARSKTVSTLECAVRTVNPPTLFPTRRRPRAFDAAERPRFKFERGVSDIFDFNLKPQCGSPGKNVFDVATQVPSQVEHMTTIIQ